MGKQIIDNQHDRDILTPEEVARYLRKSTSWVYKHWKVLGGRKLGGSLFFPSKEELYERIFKTGIGVAVRLHPEGDQVHGGLVQNKNSAKKGRSRKKRGGVKTKTDRESSARSDPNRHGLFGIGQ